MEVERRRQPRYAISAPIAIGVVSGTTVDLSLTGVSFISPQQYDEGETLQFSVVVGMSSGAPLQIDCTGTVSRSVEHEGQFLTASSIDQLRIATENATRAHIARSVLFPPAAAVTGD